MRCADWIEPQLRRLQDYRRFRLDLHFGDQTERVVGVSDLSQTYKNECQFIFL